MIWLLVSQYRLSKPILPRAKKSVSNFRLREGQAIGCSVTLRGARMWEFMDRLMCVALPRVRDFGGISRKAFDGRGNYTLGLKDQTIFPEVEYDSVERVTGTRVPHSVGPRREGDPPALVAVPQLSRSILGFQPAVTSIDEIVATAWTWRKAHPQGYSSPR